MVVKTLGLGWFRSLTWLSIALHSLAMLSDLAFCAGQAHIGTLVNIQKLFPGHFRSVFVDLSSRGQSRPAEAARAGLAKLLALVQLKKANKPVE